MEFKVNRKGFTLKNGKKTILSCNERTGK